MYEITKCPCYRCYFVWIIIAHVTQNHSNVLGTFFYSYYFKKEYYNTNTTNILIKILSYFKLSIH